MTFPDLLPGESVFLDANTLVYHFSSHATFGAACTQLVRRIESQDLAGFTSTQVLGEGVPPADDHRGNHALGCRLRASATGCAYTPRSPQLTAFRQAVDQILHSGIQVLTIPPPLLSTAAGLCQHIGLLTNDGLVVAVMQANGLMKLASNDADFDRVPGLTRYAPA